MMGVFSLSPSPPAPPAPFILRVLQGTTSIFAVNGCFHFLHSGVIRQQANSMQIFILALPLSGLQR